MYVAGNVADVRPYIQQAAVFVCPLRVGAGVKNKVLAAMAMAKPVVATSVSIEGLEVEENVEVLVADNPGEFARKVVHLLKNPSDAQKLGQRGYANVRKRYSWKAQAGALEDALVRVVNGEMTQ